MDAYRPAVPPRRAISLTDAARLEIGLLGLESGNLPSAIGSLASIDDASWASIVDRFPWLPDLVDRLAAR